MTKKQQEINPKDIQYAPLNRRIIASTVDVTIITIILTPIMNILSAILYGNKQPMPLISEYLNEHNNVINLSELLNFLSVEGIIYKYIFIQSFVFIFIALYFILFWAYKGATPGKYITKCRIVDSKTFKPATMKQCTFRFFGYIISTLTLCIGFFAIEFNKKKLGLHDLIAKTAVIKLGHHFKKNKT